MNPNELLSKIKNIDKKIHELSNAADSLNTFAQSSATNYNSFKQAAEKYQELVNAYKEYLLLVEPINSNKTLLLLNANMYHEKYDYNVCYGQYYSFKKDFERATSFYEEAVSNIKKATYYISESLKENLTKEEQKNIEHDYNVWSLDSLLIEAMNLSNESNSALNCSDYKSAYDKTQALIDSTNKIYATTINKAQYFTYEDQRKYKAQIAALHANLFSINNLQSTKDFNANPSRNTFIDIILYLTHSYEYTVKAIEINNFWPDYKITRDNIYNEIVNLLYSHKQIWLSLLQKSNNNDVLIEIMNTIDSKYYKKITNTGGLLNMNIFKNIVKTKGTVVVNNGDNNHTSIMQSSTILSSTDIDKLKSFINYLKNTPSNDYTSEEYVNIISKLNAIASAETSTQQEKELKNWNSFKANLSQSALSFLSLSSNIVTIGTFLKQLLGL